ncbi:MAG: IS66 family transposase [Oligoflexus sp.]
MIGPPIILFQYHTSRGAKVLESFLTDYQGTIVCDGLSSYDSFEANNEGVTLAACMAHIRRKFYLADKALRKSIFSRRIGSSQWSAAIPLPNSGFQRAAKSPA